MEFVQMTHPDLEQTITVPKSAVSHHIRAGWVPAEDEAPPPTTVAAADEGGKPKPRTRKRTDNQKDEE